jgi:hypothetical protein
MFSIFAIVKTISGEKQVPAKELITGSVQRSPAGGKTPSSDPTASFLAPAASNLAHGWCKAPWWIGQFHCRVRGQSGCDEDYRTVVNFIQTDVP